MAALYKDELVDDLKKTIKPTDKIILQNITPDIERVLYKFKNGIIINYGDFISLNYNNLHIIPDHIGSFFSNLILVIPEVEYCTMKKFPDYVVPPEYVYGFYNNFFTYEDKINCIFNTKYGKEVKMYKYGEKEFYDYIFKYITFGNLEACMDKINAILNHPILYPKYKTEIDYLYKYTKFLLDYENKCKNKIIDKSLR